MFGFGKKSVEPTPPHPELVPLIEEECAVNFDPERALLSRRDYSRSEVEMALSIASMTGKVDKDIIEYCHNNGINWQRYVMR
jgi:hypothetical protein